ncbi:S26 family signal peptidase [Rhizomonospora bruguierae]|uniref:S26 family signal peptidase n=1 Tax=Rhizomonospora bruguierae TaxID=1581705 RepID=UPI001BCDAA90|nr:S26 family signal peptidase [Micromonospora sp. NBRC 107566]
MTGATGRAGAALDLASRAWSVPLAGYAALALLAVAPLVAVLLVRRRWMVVRVRGGSMAPALHDGDVVLARRWTGRSKRHGEVSSPGRGDVVVLHRPSGAAIPAGAVAAPPLRMTAPPPSATASGRWLIKRVVAVAGDLLPPGIPPGRAPAGVVPPGMVVVLGDSAGFDSRLFGPVPLDSIQATVVRSLSPGSVPASRPT